MSALRFSVPGEPVRLIPDKDPYHGLSPRVRDILQAVRAYNGNRSRAARDLGITAPAVQHAVRLAAKAGVRVPDGAVRGPDTEPQQIAPRCELRMPLSGHCGRRDGHAGGCVSVRAWQRARAS